MNSNLLNNKDIDPHDLPAGTEVYLYARVAERGWDYASLNNQLKKLRQFCNEREWLVTKEFHDRTRADKGKGLPPDFEYLMYLARQNRNEAKAIVFLSYSRFFRSLTEAALYRDELMHLGFYLISLREPCANLDALWGLPWAAPILGENSH